MMEGYVALIVIFIGLPWIIFHYVTKWKSTASLTGADERLLDELHDMARRLDDRLCTIERIMNAEDPQWRQTCLPDEGLPLSTDLPRARIRRGEGA
jgi:phage shock protein B